ncbi:unnamed protein product [Lepeophtheirus salmonis]|uniref:(salmon louse) hypothetical protein n=1 Tax=Lepeophtheirus salmonis TaxID=72036 RepID=A0A7R8CCR4_LEPSM|nr:unnamed protein product [Lepeophtheirus salmonis]CAF2766315.1 unnamed protein product [Lepeophtheirus salmonis]
MEPTIFVRNNITVQMHSCKCNPPTGSKLLLPEHCSCFCSKVPRTRKFSTSIESQLSGSTVRLQTLHGMVPDSRKASSISMSSSYLELREEISSSFGSSTSLFSPIPSFRESQSRLS